MRVCPVSLLRAVVLWLSACTQPDKVVGGAMPIERDQAIATATQQTPLVTVETSYASPPGPAATRYWTLIGKDSQERSLAVWVRDEVLGQVYLEDTIPADEAMSIVESMGYKPGPPGVMPSLLKPEQPSWGVQVEHPQYGYTKVYVDLFTGEVWKR